MWLDAVALKETIIHKLLEHGEEELAQPLDLCHQHLTIRLCRNCAKTSAYWNRCENFYCPVCAPRLAREKREKVKLWTLGLRHAKHVVLTVRNAQTITPEYILWLKECWRRLRTSKFAKRVTVRTETDPNSIHFGKDFTSHPWLGGFYSIEVTNEGAGWHVHLHALIDAQFIDAKSLSLCWAKLVNQHYAIVKVKNVASKDYLQELCKYVVDGNQIAQWTGQDIVAFIKALKGVRTFGVFGSLFKERAAKAIAIAALESDNQVCDCGCNKFQYFTENEWQWRNLTHDPPVPTPQPAAIIRPEFTTPSLL